MAENIILILAAGNSSRLGEPKQLILIDGTTLLNKVVVEGIRSNASKVVVMLGAYSQEIKSRLPEYPGRLNTVVFPDWEKGMGATIKIGVDRILLNYPDVDNLIIATCDQPYVDYSLFNQLIEKADANTQLNIIASRYNVDSYGVPVLFKKERLDLLLDIDDTKGAKSVVLKHLAESGFVDFPQGAIDIDTRQDLEKFRYGL